MTLDLHGIKYQDVKQLLDSFIWVNMLRGESTASVITGNSPTMKQIVKAVTDEYGLRAFDNFNNTVELVIDFI